jgi:peptidoglycan-N-acetylglucosamine deacetylase
MAIKGKYCLITNDVETTSIINHRLDDNTAEKVYKEGMPRLLELYQKYDVTATFFFTAHIAKLIPEVVKMVIPYGHEVGSHGYTHEPDQAFDVLSLNEQKDHLQKSKQILEDICGQKVVSFRAPAARVNKDTAQALLETGFNIDSSISSQRIDMFMSFGAIKKLNWLFTPRLPYFTSEKNIFKKGHSDLLEIPISAFGFPYIGTSMRVAPGLNKMTRKILHLESGFTNKPIVFLTHPNEFIDEIRDSDNIQKRGKTLISYYLGDVLRHKLKSKNLGLPALSLLEKELAFFQKKEYEFISSINYYNLIKNEME